MKIGNSDAGAWISWLSSPNNFGVVNARQEYWNLNLHHMLRMFSQLALAP
jgi:hypothetical protein